MPIYGEFVPPSTGLGNVLLSGVTGSLSNWANDLIKPDNIFNGNTDVFTITHKPYGRVAATGTITTVAKALLVNGDKFTITDPNYIYTFYFDVSGAYVPAGGYGTIAIRVDVSTDVTADNVRDRVIAAVNGSTSILITAANGGAATVALTADNMGTAYNLALTETVGAGGFAVAGLLGGLDGTANGCSTGWLFRAPNVAGTVKDLARISATYTDVTAGSEDADIVFSTMQAGTLTECCKFGFKGTNGLFSSTALGIYGTGFLYLGTGATTFWVITSGYLAPNATNQDIGTSIALVRNIYTGGAAALGIIYNQHSACVAATQYVGQYWENTTAALDGFQQWSPLSVWKGYGWGTTAGTSQAVEFAAYTVPVQGLVPTGTWTLASRVGGAGAWTTRLTVLGTDAATTQLFAGTGGVSTYLYAQYIGTYTNVDAYFMRWNAIYWAINNGAAFHPWVDIAYDLGTAAKRVRNVITSVATITGAALAAGINPFLTLTGAAHTNQTTTVENNLVYFNLAQTYQWATGALATQRFIRIEPPTGVAFVAGSTVDNLDTVYIGGAPGLGLNATAISLGRINALNVNGNVRFSAGQSVGRKALVNGDFPYTALTTEYLLAVTDCTAARVINLPLAAQASTGRIYVVVDESGACGAVNTINVDPNGAETISGQPTFVINTAYSSVSFYTNGTAWFVY
jgi:hypothetical protein